MSGSTTKKTPAPHPRLSDAERLLKVATKQPGVADLLMLYEQYSKTMQRAGAYVQPRTRVVIFSTGDTTA